MFKKLFLVTFLLAVVTTAFVPYENERLRFNAQRVPIIEYHYSTFDMGDGISMKPQWFAAQVQWLFQNGFQTLTAEQLVAFIEAQPAPSPRSVVLAFDMGGPPFDDYENIIIPTLRRYHFHAVIFVMPIWVRDTCADNYPCWPRLMEWQSEGLISIGSHSLFHIDYATLPSDQILLDAGRSKALIEAKIGKTVLGICYPFDSVNPAAFSILQKLGYKFAVGGYTRWDRSVVFNDSEPYNLPRYYPYSGSSFYPVIGGTGGLTFDQMVLGAIAPRH